MTTKNTIDRKSALSVQLMFFYVRTKYKLAETINKQDIYRICKGENVRLELLEIEDRGAFLTHDKKFFIFIQDGLENNEFLRVAAHELGHYFTCSRQLLEGKLKPEEKKKRQLAEAQADYFASLLLSCPMEEIRKEGNNA